MAKKDSEFRQRLKSLLDDSGISMRQLANASGISPQAIRNYVREGRIPEAPLLHKLATALGVSMEWLLAGEGNDCRRNNLGRFDDFLAIKNPDYARAKMAIYTIYARGPKEAQDAVLRILEATANIFAKGRSPKKNEVVGGHRP